MDATLLTAIVALVVALLSNVTMLSTNLLSNRQQYRLLREGQLETRKLKRQEFLNAQMQTLLNASREYQAFLGTTEEYRQSDKGGQDLATIIGEAINACLSTGDEELRIIAEGDGKGNGLTPYRVQQAENGSAHGYLTRDRDAFLLAIKRMAQLLIEAGK